MFNQYFLIIRNIHYNVWRNYIQQYIHYQIDDDLHVAMPLGMLQQDNKTK